jgi:hypothetical protein
MGTYLLLGLVLNGIQVLSERLYREDGMGGERSVHGGDMAYNIFVGNIEGKKPIGRPISIWKCSIKTNIK